MAFSIEPGKTCWLLVADTTEPRHLYDLGLGYAILRTVGYQDADIHVYTSHPLASLFLKAFGVQDSQPLDELLALESLPRSESTVVVVSGHGSPTGIGAINPAPLVASIRRIPGLKLGVIVLGQCYAGVFNPMDATTKPVMVAMGATCLDTSLSCLAKINLDGLPRSGWLANSFLLSFFAWIIDPIDIDGDGVLTIADAYKCAGVEMNKLANSAKVEVFLEAQRLATELSLDDLAPALTDLEKQAKTETLKENLSVVYQSQVPWLLNARESTSVVVKAPAKR